MTKSDFTLMDRLLPASVEQAAAITEEAFDRVLTRSFDLGIDVSNHSPEMLATIRLGFEIGYSFAMKDVSREFFEMFGSQKGTTK